MRHTARFDLLAPLTSIPILPVRLIRRFSAVLLLAAATTTPLLGQISTGKPKPNAGAEQLHRFGWVLDGALEMGGDRLVTLIFTDGSTQKIYAGQGGTISVGADYRPAAMPQLGLRATAGLKFTTNASENSDISFTRIPIEVVGSYYLPNDLRVGAGLAYHTAVNFKGDAAFSIPDVNFDPAAGYTVELGWKWVALTYTGIEYGANGASIDASAVGVSFSWIFGKRY